MSLDWSVCDMKNYDVLTTFVESTGNRKWHPVTETLIWATMSVGINHITEDNWQDFYERLYLYERVTGAKLMRGARGDEKNFITPAEVYMHIGLSTNASSKTKTQFMKELYEWGQREASRGMKQAPETYKALGLETISEEDFQKSMRVAKFEQWDSIEAMVKRTQEGWTPETDISPTENIGSIPAN